MATLMLERLQRLGHAWVDVLKVDIEGSEYSAFSQVASQHSVLPFTQLQLEVHVMDDVKDAGRSLALLYNFLHAGLRSVAVVRHTALAERYLQARL